MKRSLLCLAIAAVAVPSRAEEITSYEDGPDGIRYKVTKQVYQRSIPTTEYQTREQKLYRPQVKTEVQTYQQTYLTPVTEYQWVPRLRGRWNPFGQPYWEQELTPVTRWEARPTTVQVPVARTEWVEETRTTQVPVTTYRTVPEEYTSRVAVSASPAGGAVGSIASKPAGSQQLQSDPPREASPWTDKSNGAAYRR